MLSAEDMRRVDSEGRAQTRSHWQRRKGDEEFRPLGGVSGIRGRARGRGPESPPNLGIHPARRRREPRRPPCDRLKSGLALIVTAVLGLVLVAVGLVFNVLALRRPSNRFASKSMTRKVQKLSARWAARRPGNRSEHYRCCRGALRSLWVHPKCRNCRIISLRLPPALWPCCPAFSPCCVFGLLPDLGVGDSKQSREVKSQFGP